MERCRTQSMQKPATLVLCFYSGEELATQQTQNICIRSVQRRPNVGPTLYKCFVFTVVQVPNPFAAYKHARHGIFLHKIILIPPHLIQ